MAFQHSYENDPLYPGRALNQHLLSSPTSEPSSRAISNNPSGNDNDFQLLGEQVKTRLNPLRDPRVWMGISAILGFYWEWKAVVRPRIVGPFFKDPIPALAIAGVIFSIALIIYSALIAFRVLPIYHIITAYHTQDRVLVPSRQKSQQSIRKAIPFVAAVFHALSSLAMCNLLIHNDSWDWADQRNQILVGLATQHAFAFLISCMATLREFASGWEHNRYYSHLHGLLANTNRNSPSSHQQYNTGDFVYNADAIVATSSINRTPSEQSTHKPMPPLMPHQVSINHSGPYHALDAYDQANAPGIAGAAVGNLNPYM